MEFGEDPGMETKTKRKNQAEDVAINTMDQAKDIFNKVVEESSFMKSYENSQSNMFSRVGKQTAVEIQEFQAESHV